MGLVGLGPAWIALSLLSSVLAAGLSVAAWRRADDRLRRLGRSALGAASATLTLATVALGAALVRGDWSLVYVADYASRSTSWPYRLSALWAGMAGSLLVWAWFLGAWGVAAAWWCGRRRPALGAVVQAVMAVLVALFAGLLVWAEPPFARLAIPAIDGAGLTPVLRHPAMLYHPPLLYAGAVGLAVPFALAVAGRLAGGAAVGPASWLAPARRWALAALALLTVGMVAGAHWAYVELGWGGYWAWDPVENGSLLPWLAGVAFVHAAVRAERAGGSEPMARRAALLAGATFGLGLLGAFLTRSGATGSVHAFAEATAVGRVLGAALVVLVGGWAATAWARRRRRQPDEVDPPQVPDRPLAVNLALLLAVLAVVGVGTVLPLAWRILTGEALVVGGRYFALLSWPLALAVLATVGPATRRGRGRRDLRRDLRWAAAGTGTGLVLAAPLGVTQVFGWAALGLGGASAALLGTEVRGRRRPLPALATLVAHLGVVVLLVGVAGTAGTERRTGPLGPGQDLTVGGYTLRLERVEAADPGGPGAAVRAEIALARGGDRVATLRPEALVTATGQRVSVAGLRSTPVSDVLVVLRSVGPDGRSAVVEASVLPLAAWIWWGGLLVAAGLALAAVGPTHELATDSRRKQRDRVASSDQVVRTATV